MFKDNTQPGQNNIRLETIRDNLGKSHEPIRELAEDYWERYDSMQKHIARNPRINKDNPMIYYASGDDILTFLGTEVKEAYFIDPIYQSTDSIMARAKVIDPNATSIEYTFDPNKQGSQGQLLGHIDFLVNGRQGRRIYVDSHSGQGGYLPEAVKTNGCSVFASIGHGGITELFTPPINADAYVTSTVLPTAWGYQNLIAYAGDPSELLTVAYGFMNPHLTKREDLLLVNSDAATNFFPDLIKGLIHNNPGEIEQARGWMEMTLKMYGKQTGDIIHTDGTLEDTIRKALPIRFSDLKELGTIARNRLIKDVKNLVERNLSSISNPQARRAKMALLDVMASLGQLP